MFICCALVHVYALVLDSPNMVFILNPRPGYACITCSIDAIIVLFFMSLTSSAVPKFILHDVVITN